MEHRNEASLLEGTPRTAAHQGRLTSTLPERIEGVLEALADPGSAVLLIGEPGMGKSRIAQEVAYSLEARLGRPVAVTVLLSPAHPLHGAATLLDLEPPGSVSGALLPGTTGEGGDPQDVMRRVFARLVDGADDTERVLVASGIEEYPPAVAYLFDQLVRSRRIRVIATAHHLTGAAALISGDPRVAEIPVKRFTREESARYLQQLLGCELVEARTLDHWHRITRGAAFSLQLLVTAMEGGSRLGRRRGVVWEHSTAEGAPEEFGAYLRSICSPAELDALEVISIAEPLSEASLLRMLDPEVVTSLRRRGLAASHLLLNRGAVLSVGSPAFREAILQQTSPQRRGEIGTRLFEALRDETAGGQLRPSADRIYRLVVLGLEADRSLPFDWLWQAMEFGGEPDAAAGNRRIALAVARHAEAAPLQGGIAALRAARESRVCGDLSHPLELVELLQQASERLLESGEGGGHEAIAVELELVRALRIDAEDHTQANRRLDELRRRIDRAAGDGSDERNAVVEAARAYALACAGSLQAAKRVCASLTPGGDGVRLTVHAEWARLKSRLVDSLIRSQQGAYTEAMLIAENAKHFAEYGANPQLEDADLLAFARFFAIWSGGSVEASRTALGELEDTVFSRVAHSGLVETAAAMQSLLEGRWRLAVQEAEQLRDRLAEREVHGLRPVVCAVLALGFAALGERDEAVRAIREAERPQQGLAQAMIGTVRLLTLRARVWLCEGESVDDGITEARRLAGWAAEEGLPDIELKALHAGLLMSPQEFASMLPRIEALASRVEPPLGALLARHAREFLDGSRAWDSPAARSLAEFGIWMPLPPTAKLSEREREVALLAALGYSSRWIADQYFLSVRTVETHLSHVFTKLGASNRDELRLWFRRERHSA